jgi:ubiquinone/menaquinone biosynthesis C-methylase UbiE
VQRQWTVLGERDPLWAILTEPDKKDHSWDQAAFFQTGADEIDEMLHNARALAPIRFGSAVDFGCGVGRLSQALSRHFERVTGVDIAEPMIRGAEALNQHPERCRYIHNAAGDLSILQDNSTDLIYSNITLQHVVPALARTYIREFFRIARPGAFVVFQIPCRPRSVAWAAIKKVLPRGLSNMIWRLRTGSPEAIETYSMSEKRVAGVVEQSGGTVLKVNDDKHGPPGWQSRKYYCVRRVTASLDVSTNT